MNGMKVGPGHCPAFVNRDTFKSPGPSFLPSTPISSLCAPLHTFPNMPTLSFPFTLELLKKTNCGGENKTAHVYIYIWI